MFGLSLTLVDKLMALVGGCKDEVIAELRMQNARLLDENVRLRQRADLAVDALLQAQTRPSVMPEKHYLSTPEDKAAAQLRARQMADLKAELEKVGDTGSHPDDLVDGKAPAHVEELV